MLVNFSSELNCASWATNSVSDWGSVGFWFCNCVTSSFRNALLPIEPAASVPRGAGLASGAVAVDDVATGSRFTIRASFHHLSRVLECRELVELFHLRPPRGIAVSTPHPVPQAL